MRDLFIQETNSIDELTNSLVKELSRLDIDNLVDNLNLVREKLHAISPFKKEPVDFVRWVKNDKISANDYNPNSVAPPEMELLRLSISEDGYTQPIVGNEEGDKIVVVDGFHRHRVGKECQDITQRVQGYLPIVQIRAEQVDLEHRMASTIRHNRARGKHKVEAMSDIVMELKNRNWTNKRIAKELGMEQDEVLRLCQITGLSDLFSDSSFSEAWEAEGQISEADFEDLKGDKESYVDDDTKVITQNTSDENRVFHTYDKWECEKAGLYKNTPPEGMTKEQCKQTYKDFLTDSDKFESALNSIIESWKYSCEHYLTNSAMNRIAYLGQAAVCYATKVPSAFSGGWFLLTESEQLAANNLALKYLNIYLKSKNMPELTLDEAVTTRQSDIY
jgi:ParB-like chromosome segregation protein Spo0J